MWNLLSEKVASRIVQLSGHQWHLVTSPHQWWDLALWPEAAGAGVFSKTISEHILVSLASNSDSVAQSWIWWAHNCFMSFFSVYSSLKRVLLCTTKDSSGHSLLSWLVRRACREADGVLLENWNNKQYFGVPFRCRVLRKKSPEELQCNQTRGW